MFLISILSIRKASRIKKDMSVRARLAKRVFLSLKFCMKASKISSRNPILVHKTYIDCNADGNSFIRSIVAEPERRSKRSARHDMKNVFKSGEGSSNPLKSPHNGLKLSRRTQN